MKALKQAMDIALAVRRVTSSHNFTGEPELAEEEIEAYGSLMEQRAPLIQKLAELKKEVGENVELEQIISDIIELDKRHRAVMKHIEGYLRSSLKEMKSGQRLSTGYSHPYEHEPAGTLDARQ